MSNPIQDVGFYVWIGKAFRFGNLLIRTMMNVVQSVVMESIEFRYGAISKLNARFRIFGLRGCQCTELKVMILKYKTLIQLKSWRLGT